MPFQCLIKVGNPSPYERSDYIEIDDLNALAVPSSLDETTLRLTRHWPGGASEEVAFQIDYPFGREAGYRTLIFLSRNTPGGDENYSQVSAEFSLEEGTPNLSGAVRPEILDIEHYLAPGERQSTWDPTKDIRGVELSNGCNGLRAYFSLVPRPDTWSPYNYAGAATSILHWRALRTTGAGEALAPYDDSPEKRWGQLTQVDFCPFAGESGPGEQQSLLQLGGEELRYELVWSRTGPVRATVTLRSAAVKVRHFAGPSSPSVDPGLTCRLYRVLFVYPNTEFYTERLSLRPAGEGSDFRQNVPLYFRPHFYSYLSYPEAILHEMAKPDYLPMYFAIWKSFGPQHRGYGFACDSDVSSLEVSLREIRWRLQPLSEHRFIHLFPFHCYPEEGFAPFHEVGHYAWYERIFKPLRALPLPRHESH